MTLICRGARNLVDERPLHVVFAQLTGTSAPTPAPHGLDERATNVLRAARYRRRYGVGTSNGEHAAGLLSLGVDEILVAIDAGKSAHVRMRPVRQHRRAPADKRGGHADGGDGVTEIVLAVSECAFAVLPCLAPVNR